MTAPPGLLSKDAIAAGVSDSDVRCPSDASIAESRGKSATVDDWTAVAKEVERGVMDAVHADQRAAVVSRLEAAAIRLRDAELAKIAAGKEYAEALDAFNRFVAPVPAAK